MYRDTNDKRVSRELLRLSRGICMPFAAAHVYAALWSRLLLNKLDGVLPGRRRWNLRCHNDLNPDCRFDGLLRRDRHDLPDACLPEQTTKVRRRPPHLSMQSWLVLEKLRVHVSRCRYLCADCVVKLRAPNFWPDLPRWHLVYCWHGRMQNLPAWLRLL